MTVTSNLYKLDTALYYSFKNENKSIHELLEGSKMSIIGVLETIISGNLEERINLNAHLEHVKGMLEAVKAKVEKNTQDRTLIFKAMQKYNIDGFDSVIHGKVKLVTAGGVRAMTIFDEVPAEFTKEKVTIVPDVEKIRQAVEAGDCNFARFEERSILLKVGL
jgi:hypothetical protein